MLKDVAKVIYKEKPFSFSDKETGKEVTMAKYTLVIDETVFVVTKPADLAAQGESLPLAVRPDQKGKPVLVIRKNQR